MKEQQYKESPSEALERVITLTGSANDAQTTTTGEYLSQTWPATGKHVMLLVTNIMRNTDHHVMCKHNCHCLLIDISSSNMLAAILLDGTEIDMRITRSKFIITATDTIDSLTKIRQ
jgi:hypothetical protein